MRRPKVKEREAKIYWGRAADTPVGQREFCLVCDPNIRSEATRVFGRWLPFLEEWQEKFLDEESVLIKFTVK